MKALLRELFPELAEKPVKRGDYCLINVSAYFEKTKFLLTLKLKNLSKNKSRPVIIIDADKETVRFVATTKDLYIRQNRPKISTEDCQIFKTKQECNGMNLKSKSIWIFAKPTKSKKLRFFYHLDFYTIKELQKEGKFKICGKCKENVINEIIFTIEKYGDYL